MNEGCSSTTPYQVNANKNGYSFVSDSGVKYNAYFNRHTGISQYPVYEFGFECEAEKRPPQDMRIRYTIREIFLDFWKNNLDVILCIYDSSDAKSRFRNRLFKQWFSEIGKDSGVEKYDFQKVENIEASLLYMKNNPFAESVKDEILSLFEIMQG